MKRFRALYGSSPIHLLTLLASLAICGYAISRLAQLDSRWDLLLWFAGAIALHDFVLFPLYTGLDRLAGGRRPGGGVNFVRVPVLLSLLLLLMFLPLILTLSPGPYESATGLGPAGYLRNWLAISAVLFVLAGVSYALRARRSGPPAARPAASRGTQHG